ncbi:hypothetical protein [Pectobacterium odoriferum]|uniref:hypothetical protein n=1 Tax=Pectobacterium odoriferum TaxID=78398 RepID=UPI002155002A|nr:hypothetical protein [Pectobacterium odoriferum]
MSHYLNIRGIARVNGCGFSQHELPELQAAQTLGGEAQDWLVLFQAWMDNFSGMTAR